MSEISLDERSALVIVDIQLDFCAGGAIPVPNGDSVVPVLNKYLKLFLSAGALIVATRDWHPASHSSFKSNGGVWPTHCVMNTKGARFHPDLNLPRDFIVVSKGEFPDDSSYSNFERTSLLSNLRDRKTENVYIGGLATDYCVRATVIDSVKLGFTTYLLSDASRGVDVNHGDSMRAISEMVKLGATEIVKFS
ncbi:MAG: nicotinamidase [Thaumarchaeota archaeon]|nr:nicotinamidase [Nitrososphaerota archaeon]